LYAGSAESVDPVDAQDCEQRLRWENFLKLVDEQETGVDILQNTNLGEAKEQTRQVEGGGFESLQESLADQIEVGKRLLQGLELAEDENEIILAGQGDEMLELPHEMVLDLEVQRREMSGLGPCDNRKKMKANKWGAVLVERSRRNQNTKGTMMQKAMELKQKRNLEIKGKSFAALQFDSLNQIAKDINIKIGTDDHENSELIDKMIRDDKDQYDNFVATNPEVVLPANLDLDVCKANIPVSIDDSIVGSNETTPKGPLKELDSLTWTEVVKRGKYRNKSRSRSNIITDHDRCTL
jgi:hypothetical protein